MGSWWRSEEMTYVSIILNEEASIVSIKELGSLGCVQLIDLNPELTPFQRRYVVYIKRCDEIERKIRYINNEIKKMDIPIQSAGSVKSFVENNQIGSTQNTGSGSGAHLLETLESKLELIEQQLIELNKYNNKLTEEYSQKVEFHHLLIKSRKFLGEATNIQRSEVEILSADNIPEVGFSMSPLVSNKDELGLYQDDMTFSNIAGVVPTSDRVRFERMIYRSTRGNCYIRFSTLNETAINAKGEYIDKVCFIIFYKSSAIETKIKRICEAFSANRYNLNNLNRPHELEHQQKQNMREMNDAKLVLDKNNETRLRICIDAATNIEEWLWIAKREKGIYSTLNLFKNDLARNLLRGRGWILTQSIPIVRNALREAHISINLHPTAIIEKVHSNWPSPPTHFHTNKYTWAFQEFVNTYGLPRYKEINPALFTAASFPFLFGVMYGDIGHGSILAMSGLYLILTESRANSRGMDEILSGIYSARYMLFGMGIMAVYAGLIYNDYFSIGLDLFGSKYSFADKTDGTVATSNSEYGDPEGVYPFGVDPVWKLSSNELLFFNSLKMKMSVILGIVQMTFGIILRGINSFYFKSKLDFYCEFIPMILFNLSLFGYMVALIFTKWSIDWNERMALGTCGYDVNGVLSACELSTSSTGYCFTSTGLQCDSTSSLAEVCPLDYGGIGDGCQPPNLITTLINIALKPGNVEEPMFYGQAELQTVLLFIAFICVPWLLVLKPYLIHQQQKQAATNPYHATRNPILDGDDADHSDSDNEDNGTHGTGGEGEGGGHDNHNFSEIVIHQAIETIEFVLGMVSNTASYLRLWALSLAHTELATVFWEKALLSMIETNNPVLIFLGYGVFASVTFGVLLCMDVLECFLHALRLHWVEFQNKFFKADGFRFQPFDFHSIVDKAILD